MLATRAVIYSSWVGDKRKPDSLRSLIRRSSEFDEYRPDCRHSASVVMDESDAFEAPIACMCVSIRVSSLFCTRSPSGKRWKTPECACHGMSEMSAESCWEKYLANEATSDKERVRFILHV